MLQIIRKAYEEEGLSQRTVEVLSHSLRPGTKNQYSVYIRQWIQFCKAKRLSCLSAKASDVLEFLSTLFYDKGLGYSTINTCRSALATFLVLQDSECTLSSHPLISRFMKGVFNLRPPKPKYVDIWDVKTVLTLLRSWSPATLLELKGLTSSWLCWLR